MAALTVEIINLAGNIDPSFVAADIGDDIFTNDSKNNTFVYIKNGGGGSITATFDDTGSVAPTGAKSFDADVDQVISNGEEALVGPFPQSRFGSSVTIAYTGVSSVTVAAFRLG